MRLVLFLAGRLLGIGLCHLSVQRRCSHTVIEELILTISIDMSDPTRPGRLNNRPQGALRSTWQHKEIEEKADSILTELRYLDSEGAAFPDDPISEHLHRDILRQELFLDS